LYFRIKTENLINISRKQKEMKINFVDLKRQYDSIKKEIDNAIERIIDNTSFILGKEVTDFEKNFSDFCNTKYSVGVASGTDALFLSLKALGVGQGDEVITVANTFIATPLAISHCNAKPVLVDCNPNDYNIDISKIESAITSKTKAIMPVHLYGQPADMDPILELAEKHNLKVVEDSCQAHGAEYKKKRTGSLGNIGCFSFYPGKNLGAYGDGGAITTNNSEIYEKLKLLREYGQKKKYHHTLKGYNSRLDSIQAAVLNIKLKYLDKWNNQRIKNAKLYNELLEGDEDIIPPIESEDVKHIYHLYVIRYDARDKLAEHLQSKGISTLIHYPVPIHLQEAYSDLGYSKGSFPIAEEYSNIILSLPMFPELNEEEITYTANSIKEYLK